MGTHTRPNVGREREITALMLPEWALLHVTKTRMYVKHVYHHRSTALSHSEICVTTDIQSCIEHETVMHNASVLCS